MDPQNTQNATIQQNAPPIPQIVFNEFDKTIIKSVEDGKNVFIHGPAGTGKTTLLLEIISRIKHKLGAVGEKMLAVTAMTGAAAIHLTNGQTVHKFAGIKTGDGSAEELYTMVSKNYFNLLRWRTTRVLIIDEISMMGGGLFDKLNHIGKKIRRNDSPFGGIQIIICGDLLQLPPIKDKWVFESESWDSIGFTMFNLTISRRYSDNNYFEFLMRARLNKLTPADINLLNTRHEKYLELVKNKNDAPDTTKDLSAAINKLKINNTKFNDTKIDDQNKNNPKNNLPKDPTNETSTNELKIVPTILYPLRNNVDEFNKIELDKLMSKTHTFKAIDSFKFKVAGSPLNTDTTRNYYKTLLSDLIPEEIKIKIGAQVMLKKNIDVSNGLINGSRGVVIDILEITSTVMVKFVNNLIVPITADIYDIDNADLTASRKQIPIILGWAFTVHKSQGTTLDCVVCDLGESIFAPAQAYVALSRVRSIDGLYLSAFAEKSIRADKTALEFIENNCSK